MGTNPKRTLGHSDAAAKKLAITVDTNKVKKDVINVTNKGDELAKKIYGKGGYYDKLGDAFDRIEQYCKKALNSKGVKTEGLTKELTEAKRKAKKRVTACAARKEEIKRDYNITSDIYHSIN
jgi:hypothetical protein